MGKIDNTDAIGNRIDSWAEGLANLQSGLEQTGKVTEQVTKRMKKALTFSIAELDKYPQKVKDALDFLNNNKNRGKYIELFNLNPEDLKANLIKSWNTVINELQNSSMSLDEILAAKSSSSNLKGANKIIKTNLGDIYKYANTLTAMGVDVNTVSSEISGLVNKMSSLPNYQSKTGSSFDLAEAEGMYVAIKAIREAKADLLKDGTEVNLNPLKQQISMLETVLSLQEKINEKQREASNGNTSTGNNNSATEHYEEEAKAAKEARKELEKFDAAKTKAYAAKHNEADEVYHDYDILWQHTSINDDLSDIEKYSKALGELQEKKEQYLRWATNEYNRYVDSYNSGEDEDSYNYYKDEFEDYIRNYNTLEKEIEYVQKSLQLAIEDFTPEGENVSGAWKELIIILKEVLRSIQTINSSLPNINGVSNDSDDFINHLTDKLDDVLKEITTLSQSIENVFATDKVDEWKNVIVDAINEIKNQTSDKIGNGLLKTFMDWDASDDIIRKGGSKTAERTLGVDKNGNLIGGYTFDKERSTSLANTILQEAQDKNIRLKSIIHSHPDSFAAMFSAPWIKKLQGGGEEHRPGDLTAWISTVDNEFHDIQEQIIKSQGEVLIFNIKQFYKDFSNLTTKQTDNNGNIVTVFTDEAQKEFEEINKKAYSDVKVNWRNYVEDYLKRYNKSMEDLYMRNEAGEYVLSDDGRRRIAQEEMKKIMSFATQQYKIHAYKNSSVLKGNEGQIFDFYKYGTIETNDEYAKRVGNQTDNELTQCISLLKDLITKIGNLDLSKLDNLPAVVDQLQNIADILNKKTVSSQDNSSIPETEKQVPKQTKETGRPLSDIKAAYERREASHSDWEKNIINRTLENFISGYGESPRTALSQLKSAHEAYENAVKNEWNWEQQYEWAVRFTTLFEYYRDNGGTEKSLSAHEELYKKLSPLVEEYRADLQAVLDYTEGDSDGTAAAANASSDALKNEGEAAVLTSQAFTALNSSKERNVELNAGLKEAAEASATALRDEASAANEVASSIGLLNEKKKEQQEFVTDKKKNEIQDVIVYRGTDGDDPFTASKSGATFWSNKKEIARQYGTNNYTKSLFSASLSMKNPFEIDAKGAKYGHITYLGDGTDEVSKRVLELTKKADDCKEALNELSKADESDAEAMQKAANTALEYNQALQELKKISDDVNNPYGTHSTDWFAEYAKNHGYDGVHFKNVIDSPDAYTEDVEPSDVYVTFQKEQIKNVQLLEKANHALNEDQKQTQEELEEQKSLYDQIYERIEKIRMLGVVGGTKDEISDTYGYESKNLEAYKMQMEALKTLTPSGWKTNPDVRDAVLNPDISIEEVTKQLVQAADIYFTCKNALDNLFKDAGINGGKVYDDAYRFLDMSSFNPEEMFGIIGETREKIALIKQGQNKLQEELKESGQIGEQSGERTANGIHEAIEEENTLQQEVQETENVVKRVYATMQKEVSETSKRYEGLEDKIKELIPLISQIRNPQAIMNGLYNVLDVDDMPAYQATVNEFARSLPNSKKDIPKFIDDIIEGYDYEKKKELAQLAQAFGGRDYYGDFTYTSINQNMFNDLKSKRSKEKMLNFSHIITEYIDKWKIEGNKANDSQKKLLDILKELAGLTGANVSEFDIISKARDISLGKVKRLWQPNQGTEWLKELLEPNDGTKKKYFDLIDISEVDDIDKLINKVAELYVEYKNLSKATEEYRESWNNSNSDEDFKLYTETEDKSKKVYDTMSAYSRLLSDAMKLSNDENLEYVKKSDYEILSSAMEMAKKKESVLVSLAQRELYLSRKTTGETRKMYDDMTRNTLELYTENIEDGSYKVDDVLSKTKNLVEDLQEKISIETDAKMLSSLNEQLDSAKIKLIALSQIFPKTTNGTYPDFFEDHEVEEKYSRANRIDYQIGNSHYSIAEDQKEYWDNLTKEIQTEEDLTNAIRERRQELVELYKANRDAEDKVDNMSFDDPNREKARMEWDSINGKFYDQKLAYIRLSQIQEEWGKSKEEASNIDVSFLDEEWREEEKYMNTLEEGIEAIIEGKKKLEAPIDLTGTTSSLDKVEEEATETAEALRKVEDVREEVSSPSSSPVTPSVPSNDNIQDVKNEEEAFNSLREAIDKVEKSIKAKIPPVKEEAETVASAVSQEIEWFKKLNEKINEIITTIGSKIAMIRLERDEVENAVKAELVALEQLLNHPPIDIKLSIDDQKLVDDIKDALSKVVFDVNLNPNIPVGNGNDNDQGSSSGNGSQGGTVPPNPDGVFDITRQERRAKDGSRKISYRKKNDTTVIVQGANGDVLSRSDKISTEATDEKNRQNELEKKKISLYEEEQKLLLANLGLENQILKAEIDESKELDKIRSGNAERIRQNNERIDEIRAERAANSDLYDYELGVKRDEKVANTRARYRSERQGQLEGRQKQAALETVNIRNTIEQKKQIELEKEQEQAEKEKAKAEEERQKRKVELYDEEEKLLLRNIELNKQIRDADINNSKHRGRIRKENEEEIAQNEERIAEIKKERKNKKLTDQALRDRVNKNVKAARDKSAARLQGSLDDKQREINEQAEKAEQEAQNKLVEEKNALYKKQHDLLSRNLQLQHEIKLAEIDDSKNLNEIQARNKREIEANKQELANIKAQKKENPELFDSELGAAYYKDLADQKARYEEQVRIRLGKKQQEAELEQNNIRNKINSDAEKSEKERIRLTTNRYKEEYKREKELADLRSQRDLNRLEGKDVSSLNLEIEDKQNDLRRWRSEQTLADSDLEESILKIPLAEHKLYLQLLQKEKEDKIQQAKLNKQEQDDIKRTTELYNNLLNIIKQIQDATELGDEEQVDKLVEKFETSRSRIKNSKYYDEGKDEEVENKYRLLSQRADNRVTQAIEKANKGEVSDVRKIINDYGRIRKLQIQGVELTEEQNNLLSDFHNLNLDTIKDEKERDRLYRERAKVLEDINTATLNAAKNFASKDFMRMLSLQGNKDRTEGETDELAALMARFKQIGDLEFETGKWVKEPSEETQNLLNRYQAISGYTGMVRDDLVAQLGTLKAQDKYTKSFQNEWAELENTIRGFSFTDNLAADAQRFVELSKKIEDIKKRVGSGSTLLASDEEINKRRADIQKTLYDSSSMTERLRSQFKELDVMYSRLLRSDAPKSQLDVLNTELARLKNNLHEAGYYGKSFFTQFREGIRNRTVQTLATYFSFQDIIRYGREAITYIRELDSALTELRVVSNASGLELNRIAQQSYETAKAIGSTTTEVVSSITEWRRLGKSIEESNELAKQSAILSTGGFMDVSTATEALTSTLQAFDEISVDNMSQAVDDFIYVGNNFAITSQDLATSLEKSSAALVAAGNSFAEAQALEVAGNTILQDADTVSNALKVLSMRLRGTKASELEKEGEDVEGLIEDASKLYATVKNLTKVQSNPEGVSIIDKTTGAYKSTYEILKEIADIYDEIDDAKKAALLETIAGKTRGAAAAAIIQNKEVLEEVYSDIESGKAVGAGEKALEQSMDSIEKKITVFKNEVIKLANDAVSSGVVKGLVDTGTSLISILDVLTDKFGILSLLAGGVGLFNGRTIFDGLYERITALIESSSDAEEATNAIVDSVTEATNAEAGETVTIDQNTGVLTFNTEAQAANAQARTITTSATMQQAMAAINLSNEEQGEYIVQLEQIGITGELTVAKLEEAAASLEQAAASGMAANGYTMERAAALKNLLTTKQLIAQIKGQTIAARAATLATNMLKSALTGFVLMAVTAAITKLVEVIDEKFIHAVEHAQEKLNEFKNSMDEQNKSYTNNKKLISESASKYAELAKGVDKVTNANKTLSDEDYKEYVELSNQLAEAFPELIKGYDDEGNKILDLADNAKEATKRLQELLQAQKDVINLDYFNNLTTVYDVAKNKIQDAKIAQNEFNHTLEKYEGRQAFEKELAKGRNVIQIAGLTPDNQATTYSTALSNALKDLPEINVKINPQIDEKGIRTLDLSKLTEEEYNEFVKVWKEKIEELSYFTNETATAAIGQELEDARHNMETTEQEAKLAWIDYTDGLSKAMQSQEAFKQLDDDMQDVAVRLVKSLSRDLSDQDIDYNWVRDNILASLGNLSENDKVKISQRIEKLLSLNPDDFSKANQDEIQKIILELAELLGQDPYTVRLAFGFDEDETAEEFNKTLNRAKNRFSKKETRRDSGGEFYEVTIDDQNVEEWQRENVKTAEQIELWNKAMDSVKGITDNTIALQKAQKKYNELLKDAEIEAKKLSKSGMIDAINEMNKGFDKLDEIYADIYNKGSFDYTKLSSKDFTEAFDSEELKDEYVEFIETVSKYPEDINKAQEAFNKLAGAFIKQKKILEGLTEENKDLAIAMLKNQGVANAEAIVQKQLEYQTEATTIEKKFLRKEGIELENASWDQVNAFINEANASEICTQALQEAALAKVGFNDNKINTAEDRKELAALAQTALKTAKGIEAAKKIERATEIMNDKTNKYSRTEQDWAADVFSQINKGTFDYGQELGDLANFNVIDYVPIDYTGGKSTEDEKKKAAEKDKKLFDWIEVKIERLEREITNLGKIADASYKSWTERTTALGQEMQKVTEEIGLQQTAYEAYMKQANAIPLSQEYKNKVINGALDTDNISDDTLKQNIEDFKELYEKALSCQDKISDLQSTLVDLSKTKFDNISTQFEDLISDIDHGLKYVTAQLESVETVGKIAGKSFYEAQIAAEQQRINDLNAELAQLQNALTEGLASGAIEYGSQMFNEMKKSIYGVEESLLDANNAILKFEQSMKQVAKANFDDLSTQFSNAISILTDKIDLTDKIVSMVQNTGHIASKAYYQAMAEGQEQNVKNLKKKYDELNQVFKDAVANGDIEEYSDDWYSMKQSVEAVKGEILDATSALIEYKNQLRQIDWDLFDRGQTRLEQLVSESQFLIDLYSKYPLFDKDTGMITNKGMATRGMLVQNFEVYKNQARELAEEVAELRKQLDVDPGDTTLIDRLRELEEAERSAILNMEGVKEALRDLREQEINALIDAISKLIDKYKESLQKQKDLYDYQKNIAEQNKNINSLKKQLMAYDNGNDTSEENRARVQKLNDDLKKAQEQLKETEYDKWISDTESLLDDFLEDLKSWAEEKLADLDAILREAIESVNLNSEQIRETINTTSEQTGYVYTEEFTKIWDNLSDSFSQNFDIENATNDVCEGIRNDVELLPTYDALASYLDGETYQLINSIASVDNAVGGVQTAIGQTNSALAQIQSRIAEYASAIRSAVGEATNAAKQAKAAADKAQATANEAKNTANAAKQAAQNAEKKASTTPTTTSNSNKTYVIVDTKGNIYMGRYATASEAQQAFNKKASEIYASQGVDAYYNFKKQYHITTQYYKKGGVISDKDNPLDLIAQQLGEDHMVAAKEGERILTAKQNENFEKLTNAFSSLSAEDMAKYSILTGNKMLGKMPTLQMPTLRTMEQNGNTEINGGISINLPNVTNKEEFVNWLKTDGQIEKIVQSMTLGKLQGKNSYDKMKY